jgi:hypothetical protein
MPAIESAAAQELGTVNINDETYLIPSLKEFDLANNHNIHIKAYADGKVNGKLPSPHRPFSRLYFLWVI